MRKLIVIVAHLISLQAISQHSIDSMLQAEKNFAQSSLVAGMNEAFLKFLDSAAVVFDQGKPVNGIEFYKSKGRANGILSWEPEFAEISSGNDFGYTTGPWEYYANNLKEQPLAGGQFITVWHLNSKGEWKFLIDFGISYNHERKPDPLKKVHAAKNEKENGGENSLKQVEEEFIDTYKDHGKEAYAEFLSSQSRLNYKGFLPATDKPQRKALLDSLPANINYTILGLGTSPMNDLGYTYGSAIVDGKQDGYLRIWRKESTGWKIAVEVLRFK